MSIKPPAKLSLLTTRRYRQGKLPSELYIQLELSDCCLTDLTKQGKTFDEEELNWMLWSVLQALGFMHARNLAHLDVKPDNIHVVGDKYKIGDLGTCTIFGQSCCQRYLR